RIGRRPLNDDPEADMVGAALGFEAQAGGGAAGPAVVAPGAASARSRICAVSVLRPLDGRQIRIVAARQLLVIPIAAPLEDVAVHVVQAPGVGGVTADLGGPIERRSDLGFVVRLSLVVGLLTYEICA